MYLNPSDYNDSLFFFNSNFHQYISDNEVGRVLYVPAFVKRVKKTE